MYSPILVQKFRALSPLERNLFIRAWFMLSWYRLQLLTASRDRIARRTRRAMAVDTGECDMAMVALARRQMAVLNRAAAYHVVNANCLVRAFTGIALLAKYGIHASLRIGVARAPGAELRAHAWLELGGHVISEDDGVRTRFAPMNDMVQAPLGVRHFG
jgi:hypothetical protein